MRLTVGLGRSSIMLSILALLTITLLSAPTSAMGVVAFDYGTEWMKVSLVKPGLPFDVVLDRDSKRKIQSAVSFKKWGLDEEILFGTNAFNHATREPKQSFYALKTLLGRTTSDQDKQYVDLYTSIFGNDVISSDRATCSLKRPYEPNPKLSSLPVLTVEELVGMQFEYAKKLAEETAGERVNPSLPSGFNIGSFGGLDAVVTVPAFFNAQERQAVVDSAILAGFRPRLVSDGAAAAVNYAQTRTFPKPEKHLFFDVGSGSVRATVVEFSTKPVVIDSILSVGKAQKEAVIVDVKGVGWERNIGGLKLDLILRDKLAAEFDAKHGAQIGSSITSNHRAMARLLKEANRIKHILSANDAASSSVESLVDEIDFRSMIQRQEFEDAVIAAGLVPKFTSPIDQALANAGFKLGDINSIVLVGGGTRVPLVQNALREAGIPDTKLAQNVNADEAAVMGAAFYGASFNPQFRMKEIRAYDLIPYAVNLKDADGKVETIFPAASYETDSVLRQYDAVKQDFIFELEYDSASQKALGANTDRAISMVEITGIDDALKDIKTGGQLDQVETSVNLTVSSRPLGTYAVENIVLVVRPKAGGIAGALKSFFGVSSTKKGASNTTATNSTTTNTNSTSKDGADAEIDESDENLSSVPAKDKHIKLTARVLPQNDALRPMSGEEIKKSKDKLWIMAQATTRKAQREEARNAIESYLYRVRDMLDDPSFTSVSKPAERDAISTKTTELSSWLNEDGETADTSSLKLKRTSLESLVKPLQTRLEQNQLRTTSFAEFEQTIRDARKFVQDAKLNLTSAIEKGESSKYSVTELDQVSVSVEKEANWFFKGKEMQDGKGPSDDPVLLSGEVDSKRIKINETINKIKKRRIAKTRPNKNKNKKEDKNQENKQHNEKEEHESKPPPRHEEL
ncbi:related to glucose regulated stress protein, HSP70-like [Melanopsichium pennsylvanicum]|uniref:Related to glucose regulated stress protein, HSP70-like n=2 Tax=Melanopsichium pennsylvanicum TaxID=63383 RepID=A0AAJ4XJL4_9BASI|nr:related to glucose regulated stress protein, HSP70-like [Melanopsichium pennsylvanicum 4]SNX82298.1 related to glucose regulated stress protein, HSP70-like [Melanopsichium pennsylvanicum]